MVIGGEDSHGGVGAIVVRVNIGASVACIAESVGDGAKAEVEQSPVVVGEMPDGGDENICASGASVHISVDEGDLGVSMSSPSGRYSRPATAGYAPTAALTIASFFIRIPFLIKMFRVSTPGDIGPVLSCLPSSCGEDMYWNTIPACAGESRCRRAYWMRVLHACRSRRTLGWDGDDVWGNREVLRRMRTEWK